MKLLHIGLTCSLEKSSDKFFVGLLGLKKLEPRTVSASLSKAIFGVDFELKKINYSGDHMHFEAFIVGPRKMKAHQIAHTCLAVNDLAAFLSKCRALNVRVSQVPRGDSFLTFVRDDDGNIFEIKERKDL